MKFRQILTVCVLILSLGFLSGFSPVLHNHDLDLQNNHEDCFSCEWNHVSMDPNTAQPVLEFQFFKQEYNSPLYISKHLIATSSFLGRAPPFASSN
ncbi:MAG: hypothetical protein COV66_15285 [Nitrospinae bacterium CG11_big_fil_rev_8_21_14_0_20_45_15]|nr:MAG: hypothetical protein COV66_15285 [Nitrospinae bacterium CG11_big_fil_rev_8_21_14_0_20_45_15]